MKKILFVVFVVFGLIGCNQANPNKEPSWIYNPNSDGKIGGVGSAKTHTRGKSAQRRVAISRALDEIATQMGTKVSTVISTSASVSSGTASSSMQTYSFQTTDGKIVKAYIKRMWHNPRTDELFVWMVVK
jgi:hypothetical protein